MSYNNETILGAFNIKKGALSWLIKGECYRVIFTSKRIIVVDAKLKFWQRFICTHEFNWLTASEKELKKVRSKSLEDFCAIEKIIEEISYSEINSLLDKEKQGEEEKDLSDMSSRDLIEMIRLIDKRERVKLTVLEQNRLNEIYSKIN